MVVIEGLMTGSGDADKIQQWMYPTRSCHGGEVVSLLGMDLLTQSIEFESCPQQMTVSHLSCPSAPRWSVNKICGKGNIN